MNGSESSSLPLWPVRPPPQTQELFTSWLIRLAQAQGAPPRVFLSTLRAQFGVGTRDLDARPSYELIAEVSRRTGVAYARIVRMTVQWHVDGIVNGRLHPDGAFGYLSSCWCKDSQLYVRRTWRLDWTPLCLCHRLPLGYGCFECRSRPALDWASTERALYICPRCSLDLRRIKVEWYSSLSEAERKGRFRLKSANSSTLNPHTTVQSTDRDKGPVLRINGTLCCAFHDAERFSPATRRRSPVV